jgi:hypothetical protein
MPFSCPFLDRFSPEDFEEADAVHRLVLQDAVKPFFAG